MSIRFISAERFAQVLIWRLNKTYGRTPTASFFANQFNLRAYGTKTITRETARKWLRGEVLPTWQNLNVLMNWLEIEPSLLYEQAGKEIVTTDEHTLREVQFADDSTDENFSDIFKNLSPHEAKILAIIALALKDSKQISDDVLNSLLHSTKKSSIKKKSLAPITSGI